MEVKTLHERATALRYTYIACLVICMEGMYCLLRYFMSFWVIILFVKESMY